MTKTMIKKNILLAEDDPLIGSAYVDGLTQANYNVTHCISGQEVLDKLKKKKPDLMLLDLRMPEKDGFEVLKEMNKNGLTKEITVIITSNLDQESDIKLCKKLGAKEYLIKSNSTILNLIKTIKKYI